MNGKACCVYVDSLEEGNAEEESLERAITGGNGKWPTHLLSPALQFGATE